MAAVKWISILCLISLTVTGVTANVDDDFDVEPDQKKPAPAPDFMSGGGDETADAGADTGPEAPQPGVDEVEKVPVSEEGSGNSGFVHGLIATLSVSSSFFKDMCD